MEQYIYISLLLAAGFVVFWVIFSKYLVKKRLKHLENTYNILLSQKKSSEVRLGQISEQLAPFLSNFPYDPKKVQFLGNPIDYIYFGEDEVVIIEVKSGNARLSKKQRQIKKLILEGEVKWKEIRIK